MDWDQIEDNWTEYKGLAAEKWERLSQSTLDRIEGSRERLIEAVQRAYDVSRDQARREVSYWSSSAPMERAARAQARVATAQRKARLGLPEFQADIRERGRWTVDATSQQIRNHPLGSLLIAFGVGMFVASVARRS